jgi:hypothetical protein
MEALTLCLAVVIAMFLVGNGFNRKLYGYACALCKSRNGKHVKDCPWSKS